MNLDVNFVSAILGGPTFFFLLRWSANKLDLADLISDLHELLSFPEDATKLETVLPPLILSVLAPSSFPHLLIQAFHTCIGSSIRWLCTLETFHTGRIPLVIQLEELNG